MCDARVNQVNVSPPIYLFYLGAKRRATTSSDVGESFNGLIWFRYPDWLTVVTNAKQNNSTTAIGERNHVLGEIMSLLRKSHFELCPLAFTFSNEIEEFVYVHVCSSKWRIHYLLRRRSLALLSTVLQKFTKRL